MNERLAFGDPLGDALKHLAYRIGSNRDAGGIGNGERAELRRWHGSTLPPAFWRLAVVGEVAAAIDERVGNEKDRLAVERAFATIMKSMAIMGPLAASSGERMPLGAALGATRYSEDRFVRLLRARDDVLTAEAATALRWCAVNARPIEWRSFARLVFAAHGVPGFDREREVHEQARRYFSAADRAERTASDEANAA